MRAQAAAAERRLLAAYDATTARHPGLRPVLAPLRAHHAEHLAAVQVSAASAGPVSDEPVPGGLASGAPTTTGPSAGGLPRAAAVPGRAAAAVTALVSAERAAARRAAGACRTAGPTLAGTLASIGASEAAHAAVLPALARRVSR